jgi:Protein of unknown function (DUF5663)
MMEPLKKLDAELLARLGYKGLTANQFNELLAEFFHAAEEIVGILIASQMSDEQLDEFERFFDAGDDDGAFAWLEEKFPNYKEDTITVIGDLERLLAETAREIRQRQTTSQSLGKTDTPPHPTEDSSTKPA